MVRRSYRHGIRPSYQTGFARSAGESAYPQFWKGQIGAWVPELGPTGNTLRDVSGFGNHGTLQNMDPATDWVIGGNPRIPGYVLDYDGSDDQAAMGDVVDVGTADITGVMWVKFTSANSMSIIAKREGTGAGSPGYLFGIDLGVGDGRFLAEIADGSVDFNIQGTTAMNDGLWHHIVCGFDRNNAGNSFLLVDGVADISGTSGTMPTGSMANAVGLFIGDMHTGTLSFAGNIGQVRLYDRLLLRKEAILDYQIGLAFVSLRPRIIASVPAVGGGRTTRNTHSNPLGHERGMEIMMP